MASHNHNWVKVFSRPQTIQRIGFLWPWFTTGVPQNKALKMDSLLILPSEKKYDYYICEDEWMSCLQKLSEYMLSQTVEQQEKEFTTAADWFTKEAQKVHNKDLTKWSNKKLIDWFKAFSKAYTYFSVCVFPPWTVDILLAPRLRQELEKVNPEKAASGFEAISTQPRHDRMTQQQIDLLKIGASKDFKKLKKHTEKYFWLPVYNLGDKPWAREDFKKQLADIKDPKKELKEKIEGLKNKQKAYEITLREIKPSATLRRLIETVHLYTFLRNERVDRWRIVLCYIEPFYHEIARRAKILPEDAVNFFDEEIIEYLEKGTLPKDYAQRKIQNAIIYRDGIRKIFTKIENIEKLRKQELGNVGKEDIKEIKGMPAYKGIVKGYVRVIHTPKDLETLKQGEILVAHHTSPDYVLTMKRAAAIVTDEGGITSHAAIVSRELKIPCVTATKEGSNVFKTGDFVEVDAERGVVTIMKRNSEKPLNSKELGVEALSKLKWHYIHKRDRTPLYTYFLWEGVSKHHNKKLKIPYEIKGVLYLDKELMIEETAWNSAQNWAVTGVEKNPSFLMKIIRMAYSLNEEIVTFAKNLSKKKLSSLDNKEVSKLFEKYCDFSYNAAAYALFPLFLENYLQENISQQIKEIFKDDAAKIMQLISTPIKQSPVQKEEINLLKLALKKLRGKGISNDVKNHVEEYAWLKNTAMDGEFYSEEDILTKVSALTIQSPDTRLDYLEQARKDLVRSMVDLKKKLSNNKRLLTLIGTLQEAIYFRSWRTERFYRNAQYLKNFFSDIAKRINLTNNKDIFFLTPLEILNLLSKQHTVSNSISERKISYIMLADGSQTSIYSGNIVRKAKETINFSEVVTIEKEVKGQIAYAGKVTGAAKIVLSKKDFSKINQGDILVTTSTTPDYVPILKKISAIVTDEGGVLSHASVISRELHIPCIIGTKIATKVFKDGDEIDVDADKGVVRVMGVSNIVQEIINTKWHHLGKWIEPALAAEVWLEYGAVAQQFFKEKLDKKILYLNGDFFLSQHDSDIFQTESYEAAKQNRKVFFEKIYRTVKKVCADIVNKSKNIRSVPEFLYAYKQLTGVWMPLNNVAVGIERYVQETNPSAFSMVKGFLDEKPWVLQQSDEMIVLKHQIEKAIGKKLKHKNGIPPKYINKVNNHVKKYEWLGTHHFNISRLTVDGLIDRMKQSKDDSSEKHTVENKKTAYLVWLLDLIGYARFKAAETSGFTTFYLAKHLSKLAMENGLAYDEIVEHTIEEISSGNITKEIAQRRKNNAGFYFSDTIHLLLDDQIKTLSNALLKLNVDSSTELKGLSAQVGKAIGKVKIVTCQEEMEGFEEGMILVAYETTPDIIFAMQKAAAIITDFGGLTSHAAIVAREFKKPCIVGTKIATKVFKDGDLVEVDANKGVVRKLR